VKEREMVLLVEKFREKLVNYAGLKDQRPPMALTRDFMIAVKVSMLSPRSPAE
jgi:hypothetical protein